MSISTLRHLTCLRVRRAVACASLVMALSVPAVVSASTQTGSLSISPEIHAAVSQCIDTIAPGATVHSNCPALSSLLTGSDNPALEYLTETSAITATELRNFQAAMDSVQGNGVDHWSTDSQSLAAVMGDYDFATFDEEITASDRFWNWLREKLEDSKLSKGLEKLGDSMTMGADARDRLKKFAWFIGGLVLMSALGMLAFTLWRYIDPVKSPRRNEHFGSTFGTGAGRGGLPVMTLEKIRDLPEDQQPAALLVAAVDQMRGNQLPRDPWAWTNAEIATAVAGKAQGLLEPLNVLIRNAERTLYGGIRARAEDIAASFAAANAVIGATTAESTDGSQ